MTFDTKQKSSKNKDQIMPSKKKKYNARFPAGRIKKIMQTDEEVGKVAQAVPVIISRTLELFVESLLRKSMQITLTRNAKTLTPSHMKQCILSESRFDFLKDLVKDIPDASVQEDNENNAIFEDSLSQNQNEVDTGAPPIEIPSDSSEPSPSKRKRSSSTERAPKEKAEVGPRRAKRKRGASAGSSSNRYSNSKYITVRSFPYPYNKPLPPLHKRYPSSATRGSHSDRKDRQHQETTSNRKPVIQYTPKLTEENDNQPTDGVTQASQLSFSVNNLLNQNVASEESNIRITIASEHLSPPPLAMSTSGSIASSRLAPSDNVPPLVPFNLPPVPVSTSQMQPKYLQSPGDLSIDEDYDN